MGRNKKFGGHRDRSTHKGERYVRQYRLDRWINQCLGCQARGYSPEMAELAESDREAFAARYLMKQFEPLRLDGLGLCGHCRREGLG